MKAKNGCFQFQPVSTSSLGRVGRLTLDLWLSAVSPFGRCGGLQLAFAVASVPTGRKGVLQDCRRAINRYSLQSTANVTQVSHGRHTIFYR